MAIKFTKEEIEKAAKESSGLFKSEAGESAWLYPAYPPVTVKVEWMKDIASYPIRQQSIEKSKPWIAEGISRRTWYRRRKANAP